MNMKPVKGEGRSFKRIKYMFINENFDCTENSKRENQIYF